MELVIDGIPVEVNRKKIKNMYLYVKPPAGAVTVSAPMRMPRQDIERFVREKRGWIEKRQEACRENRICQEKLQEEMKEKMKEKIRQQEQGRDRQEAGRAAQVDVRTYLREEIAELLLKWEERTGLHCSGFQIRDMKTRWGSCNTRTGKLWFSLMLAWQPRECVEYVILHELAHLYEPSHSARFKAFLDLYMPEWRETRRKLR